MGPAPAPAAPPSPAPEAAAQPLPAAVAVAAAAPAGPLSATAFNPEFVNKSTQDYTNIPGYYTSSHWRVMNLGVPATQRLEMFSATPRALGCYHPSEETAATIVGCYLLACAADPEVMKLTPVQKHVLMDIVKQSLRPRRGSTGARVFLKQLPENPAALQRHGATAGLFTAAYTGEVPVRFPHPRADLYTAVHSFPWRMSKLVKNQGLQQGVEQGAQQWGVAGPQQAMTMLQGLLSGVALLQGQGQGQMDAIPGMRYCDRSQRSPSLADHSGDERRLALTGGDSAAGTGGAGVGAPAALGNGAGEEVAEAASEEVPAAKKRKSPEEAASALLAQMDSKKMERKQQATEEKKQQQKQEKKQEKKQKVRGPAPQLPKIDGKAAYMGASVKRFADRFKVHIPRAVAKDGKECDVTKVAGGDPSSAFKHCLSYIDARV